MLIKSVGSELVYALTGMIDQMNTELSKTGSTSATNKIKALQPETQGPIADIVRGLLKLMQLCLEKMEQMVVAVYHVITQLDSGIAMVEVAGAMIDKTPAIMAGMKAELSKVPELTYLVDGLPDVSGINFNFSNMINFVSECVIAPASLAYLAQVLNKMTGCPSEPFLGRLQPNQPGILPELVTSITKA